MSDPVVGVYRSDLRSYSNAWKTEDDFPEKDALLELSRVLGHESGNLLEGVVKPGQRVTIKPNWVLNFHPTGLDLFSVITHSAMLRAVTDLAFEAMNGDGHITIADAPQFNTDFDDLLRVTEVERISEYYRERHGFDVAIVDLRQIATVAEGGIIKSDDRFDLPGDPRGYAVVNFGSDSAFVGLENPERIYGADYDRAETRKHHNDERHEYLVSKTMLDADVLIHVPKLKVHKKVGITVNAKGMVGINGNKNWLAHYRVGPPAAGGDEFPDEENLAGKARAKAMRLMIDHLLVPGTRPRELLVEVVRRVYRLLKPLLKAIARRNPALMPGDDMLHGGNWHGNDTAWRMTADLARAILFADSEGRVHDEPQRRFFSIVDGIVAGEVEGPLAPDPKPCGVLLAGDLLATDLVCGRLMGFDWRKITYQRWLLGSSPNDMGVGDPEDIEVRSNVPEWEGLMRDPSVADLEFKPHPGWIGHIELERGGEQAAREAAPAGAG